MNKLKYRVWDGKQWFEDDLVYISPEGKVFSVEFYENEANFFEREDFVISVFTGLLDKNGKEIWEGDLISFLDLAGTAPYVREVEWDDDAAAWAVNMNDAVPATAYWPLVTQLEDVEVAGDIYTTPELLEESK